MSGKKFEFIKCVNNKVSLFANKCGKLNLKFPSKGALKVYIVWFHQRNTVQTI